MNCWDITAHVLGNPTSQCVGEEERTAGYGIAVTLGLVFPECGVNLAPKPCLFR